MHLARTSIFVLAVGFAGAACSDSDSPTSIEIDIAEIEINAGVCAIPEGATCNLSAEARTADGVVVSNPTLRWSSSNVSVATVQGESSAAVVRGIAIGSATVTVTNSTEDVSDAVPVSVLPCSKC